MLGPLQDNGRPTLTHVLLPSSPAINTDDPTFTPLPLYDERRRWLLVYSMVALDVGSFEAQPPRRSSPTPKSRPHAAASADFLYSDTPKLRLTENIRCLRFAPVRVVDQRNSRAKYFPRSWDRFSFAINYPLLVRRTRPLRRPVFPGSPAMKGESMYEGWIGEGGSASNSLSCWL
jgi:hypothetical protein